MTRFLPLFLLAACRPLPTPAPLPVGWEAATVTERRWETSITVGGLLYQLEGIELLQGAAVARQPPAVDWEAEGPSVVYEAPTWPTLPPPLREWDVSREFRGAVVLETAGERVERYEADEWAWRAFHVASAWRVRTEGAGVVEVGERVR